MLWVNSNKGREIVLRQNKLFYGYVFKIESICSFVAFLKAEGNALQQLMQIRLICRNSNFENDLCKLFYLRIICPLSDHTITNGTITKV